MRWFFVILVIVIPTFAAPIPKCKGNPKVIDACYSIHGRINLGADTIRLRLWPIGTDRLLGVKGGPNIDDAGEPIFPQNLKLNQNDVIYGDFEVCPFTQERKGTMRFVCIESAYNLVTKH